MMSRIIISIIWYIFAVLFGILGSRHWQDSKNFISPFPHVVRSSSELEKMQELNIDIDEPINRFVPSFNLFLNKFNASTQQQNKSAAYGYWIACGTCFTAMFLEWRDKLGLLIKRLWK